MKKLKYFKDMKKETTIHWFKGIFGISLASILASCGAFSGVAYDDGIYGESGYQRNYAYENTDYQYDNIQGSYKAYLTQKANEYKNFDSHLKNSPYTPLTNIENYRTPQREENVSYNSYPNWGSNVKNREITIHNNYYDTSYWGWNSYYPYYWGSGAWYNNYYSYYPRTGWSISVGNYNPYWSWRYYDSYYYPYYNYYYGGYYYPYNYYYGNYYYPYYNNNYYQNYSPSVGRRGGDTYYQNNNYSNRSGYYQQSRRNSDTYQYNQGRDETQNYNNSGRSYNNDYNRSNNNNYYYNSGRGYENNNYNNNYNRSYNNDYNRSNDNYNSGRSYDGGSSGRSSGTSNGRRGS